MTICRTWGQHVLFILNDIICSKTFYFILPSLMINVVTTLSDCDWCDQSLLTLTLVVLKIENRKIKIKIKIKIKEKPKNKVHFQQSWHFLVQLCLWKSVYWLWRYKVNKFCNTILLVTHFHSNNATTQISSLPWWEYSCQTQSLITKFSYPTTVSVLLLKSLFRTVYWNSEHLLHIQLVYKTSSYTVIHQSNNWQR